MNAVKKIREDLGQTQDVFAFYLGVSRALLAKHETGQRSLPTAAMLKLVTIVRQMTTDMPSTLIDAETQKQSMQAKNKLLAQARKYDVLAAIATYKLEAMRERHIQCFKALQVSTNLLDSLPESREAEHDKLSLELMQLVARKKIRSCGPEAQALLQLEADGFSYQAERARAMMDYMVLPTGTLRQAQGDNLLA